MGGALARGRALSRGKPPQTPAGFPARLAAPATASRALPDPGRAVVQVRAGMAPHSHALASPRPAPAARATPQTRAGLHHPQQWLADAARDRARAERAQQGLQPLDLHAAQRARMLRALQQTAQPHPLLLAAFDAVPRHAFVDSALTAQAYEDTALPIGQGQTISKPTVVARMLNLLLQGQTAQARLADPVRAGTALGRVLEIGAGCGWQAALLARLGSRVVSIERIEALAWKARGHLEQLGVGGVTLVHGDGRLGHPADAPYDSIVAAAGGAQLPEAWLAQLAPGGRLVAPMEDPQQGGAQRLLVIDRTPQGLQRHWVDGVRFVPLKSGVA